MLYIKSDYISHRANIHREKETDWSNKIDYHRLPTKCVQIYR